MEILRPALLIMWFYHFGPTGSREVAAGRAPSRNRRKSASVTCCENHSRHLLTRAASGAVLVAGAGARQCGRRVSFLPQPAASIR